METKLRTEIAELKQELLLAKKILKDPNLSHQATRKFHENVDKVDDGKIMIKGAEIRELMD